MDANKVVLVADDEDFALNIVTMIFTGLKVTTIKSTNGQQALDAFKARNGVPLSYILMDIHMPVMDGYEATKQIRAYEKAQGLAPCKILGLSGGITEFFSFYLKDNDAKTKAACLASGMNDLLQKPVKKDQLAAQL